jgi:hypothetical protein
LCKPIKKDKKILVPPLMILQVDKYWSSNATITEISNNDTHQVAEENI